MSIISPDSMSPDSAPEYLPRELYLPPPDDDTALWSAVAYRGAGLVREECWMTSGEPDAYHNFARRVSQHIGGHIICFLLAIGSIVPPDSPARVRGPLQGAP